MMKLIIYSKVSLLLRLELGRVESVIDTCEQTCDTFPINKLIKIDVKNAKGSREGTGKENKN